jgi:formylmethanofuran dehydrogenase subunit E
MKVVELFEIFGFSKKERLARRIAKARKSNHDHDAKMAKNTKSQQVQEIAAVSVHGRYTSSRDINAKEARKTRCASCNQPLSKDNAYNVNGKLICSKCKN